MGEGWRRRGVQGLGGSCKEEKGLQGVVTVLLECSGTASLEKPITDGRCNLSVGFNTFYAQDDSILINEVELNPPGNNNPSGILEWIELYNPDNNAVDVSGWTVNPVGGGSIIFVGDGTSIPARSYLVIASASQWLNNSGNSVAFDTQSSRAIGL